MQGYYGRIAEVETNVNPVWTVGALLAPAALRCDGEDAEDAALGARRVEGHGKRASRESQSYVNYPKVGKSGL